MHLRPISLVLLVLVAAGCGAIDRDAPQASPSGAPAASREAPAPQAPAAVIRGHATWRERIALPPGTRLRVDLLATTDAGAQVVATVRGPDAAGPPLPFALPYAPSRIAADAPHALRAELRAPGGERWFATPVPVPVVPGAQGRMELLLRRAPDAAASDTPSTAAWSAPRHWDCGDLGLMTRPAVDGAHLRLDANARHWILSRMPAASGVRHADGRGSAFHEKGDEARLEIAGEPARSCVAAGRASPWNDALLRGIAFRAVGNEPGWYVEVEGGNRPRLRGVLDYGERPLDVQAAWTARGYAANTAGADVGIEVDVERAECTDGMSGQRFEARVRLSMGDRAYDGCGGWLAD